MKIKIYIYKAEIENCFKKYSKATEKRPIDIGFVYGDWWLDKNEAKYQCGKNSKIIEVLVDTSNLLTPHIKQK